MKNALISGLIIGILSGFWLFLMHWMGYNFVKDNQLAPFEYLSVLIPLIGLYFGVRGYRDKEQNGTISFLEALVQSFKILIVGGIVAIFGAILYVSYVSGGDVNVSDFSGRIFGALLVGILFALAVSLLLMNRSKNL